ncbi:AfsR/SARP family transcriptional regulator [Streptomyces yaizuensis]|uniref:Winged helix-turn-helix domain-containing protein n=1 Tax=Streptomyces yaizuensis TaxID=2989713 RepID=A0ABQ5NYD0_9ACTN|nr:BTAD domain-containing putative transcriptional regulator [Streptomyces sp. YSPA8]GLF95370.1 winged helix-turn-helix domain-containing protein [Streptomyces sp. YSPA8]
MEPVRFEILGQVRAWREGTELYPARPQERALLALLLIRAGQPVALSDLVAGLWGNEPPHSAVNVIHRHVGSLRRLLEPGLPARAAGRWLVRAAGGYQLSTDTDSLDLLAFRRLCEEARQAVAEDAPARAADLFTEALGLWRGPVAAGLAPGARALLPLDALDREHLSAVREAADTAVAAGRPGAVLAELRKAAADHPLDEPVQARLMLALAATGRRTEALSAYGAVRDRLAAELGIDPGPELLELHRAVLLDVPPGAAPPKPRPQALPIPAQLPHDLPTFTGRRTDLDRALALLVDGAETTGTATIAAISGMAGVGKSTFAVHLAHRLADRFPDGQLYVNLRGFDPSGAILQPVDAVRGLLDALGVPPEHIPRCPDAQAALYRSVLAGRRVLVVLDNARDTEHVRPLLPGTSGCLTLVTSRNELPGLVAAHGAHLLTLRPFDGPEARELLALRLGADRVTAEPRAVDEIIRRCAGLPLALTCLAARAAARPGFPLSAVATELRQAHGSLDAFTVPDVSVDVSTVFSWSSGTLRAASAHLFGLLALHPGPDVTAPAAAVLAGVPARRGRALLAELVGAHLVTEHAPGRYAFHDLLRAHAAELLHARHPGAEREEATDRLYGYYAATAHAACALLAPAADPVPGPPCATAAGSLTDDRGALAWLTAEYPVLLAVVAAAAASGRDRLACGLVWSLEPYFDRRGYWHDGLAAHRTALDLARGLDDPPTTARALRGLARAEGRVGLHDRSRPRLAAALDLAVELNDDIGRAHTHRSLGWESDQQGDTAGALRHNRRALDLFTAAGHRPGRASVLNSVGWYHARLGEFREALAHCYRALTTLQELGDRYGQAAAWDSIAYAHHHLGRHPQALAGYRNALDLYRELGVPYLEAETLNRMGDTHLATGGIEAARDSWGEALTLFTELGHPLAEQVGARLDEQRRGRADGTPATGGGTVRQVARPRTDR